MDYEELTDYKKLYKYIKSKMIDNKKNYIFLDEIQHVDKFEKVVDSLFIKENIDLYITGSNAYFMSSELATLLSGRYIELKMLPLSFKEYYQARLEYEKLDKKENKIYYVNDVNAQSQYINMFKEAKKEAVVLPHNIDMPFIQSLWGAAPKLPAASEVSLPPKRKRPRLSLYLLWVLPNTGFLDGSLFYARERKTKRLKNRP